MRPIDLARAVGVSTQHVRTLEAAGVLPEAERSQTGYRQYTEAHLRSLRCYHVLAPGHGAATARQIMVLVNQRRPAEALALVDTSHAQLHSQRQQLAETTTALEKLRQNAESIPTQHSPISIGQLARNLKVRTSTLRVWEDAGLLCPRRIGAQRHRLYTATDIRDARIIHLLRQSHYLLNRIRPIIEEVGNAGGTDALHSALHQRRMALSRRSRAMLDGAAHLSEHIGHLETTDDDAMVSTGHSDRGSDPQP
ncbi:MerR family transcriptional regulator [Nesterenkonia muleiensis]|uniref:MerR family transcriptional regulator n=1 Tax=Nesterenkonia muleiensis TaxID=2282648 RepID=UPI000E7475A5|nr:MerR family transcriptional regulator [Nesterenkonia muleiensis]